MEMFILIVSIAIIIVVSPILSKIINIPIVVIELFLGIIFSFFGFLYDDLIFKIVAKFGFLYLMFLAGLEINFKLIQTIKHKLFFNVIIYFISLYAVAFIFCKIFNLNFVYFIALPIFSLGMLVMLIKEYGKNQEWLNLALSIGIVGEIISILVLTIFTGLIEFGLSYDFYKSIFIMIFMIAIGIFILKLFKVIFWWYPEFKEHIVPNTNTLEQGMRFAMSLFFILLATMMYAKIDLVLGVFLAGMFLKIYFYEKEKLIEQLSSFGFGLFIPIFFIYTGSTVKLNMINMEILKHSLLIISLLITIRIISSFIAFYNYLN